MILVTGGTGLIGAHLLAHLTKQHEVIAIKRASSDLNEVKRVFAWYEAQDQWSRIQWKEVDILDVPEIYRVMEGISSVYHCAGLVSFVAADRERLMNINVQGTANVVNAALEAGVDSFCHVSSVAALGSEKSGYCNESTPFTFDRDKSHYAISKHLGEREAWRGQEEGLKIVVINPTVVLGPGMWTQSSSQIIQRVAKGLKYYTSGQGGFVDVRDVVKAMTRLMDEKHFGKRYLINGTNVPTKVILDEICDALGRPRPSIKVTPLVGAIAWRVERLLAIVKGKPPAVTKASVKAAMRKFEFDNARLLKVLDGFQPIALDQTVKDTCAAFNQWASIK